MRNMSFLTLSLALLIVAIGCNKDDDDMMQDEISSYRDIDAVTGLFMRDDNGNSLGTWRGPNDKAGEAIVFPNPNIGQVAFYSEEQFDRLWLVPADCLVDTLTFDIPGHSASLNFSIAKVDSAAIFQRDLEPGQQQIILNFEDVETGFYKLFYAKDGEFPFWQNLFIDPTVNNLPSFSILDDFCD